jgi:hypothetical protein
MAIRNNLLLLLVIFILLEVVSCKKGDNDPLFSLRSRRSRLIGEWELKSGTIITQSGALTDSTVYNGSIYMKYLNGSLVQGTYSQKLNFKKSGAYSEEIITDNSKEIIEGGWMFGDKGHELKSKEVVIVRILSDTHNSNGITDITAYSGTDCPSYSMKLDELRDRKLTIIYDGSITDQSSSVVSGSLNFVKK